MATARKRAPQRLRILLALDASGSMADRTTDTIAGVNQYIRSQQAIPDVPVELAVLQFGTRIEWIRTLAPITGWKPLNAKTYTPDQPTTRLHDAIGTLYDAVEIVEDGTPTLVVVVTDGQDNDSKRESLQSIRARTERRIGRGHWTFVYMGANQDAWAAGRSYGTTVGNTYTWTPTTRGVGQAYGQLNNATESLRSSIGTHGIVSSSNFFDNTANGNTSGITIDPANPATPVQVTGSAELQGVTILTTPKRRKTRT